MALLPMRLRNICLIPSLWAHKMARKLSEVRKNGTLPYLRPDGKTQVTVEYDENGCPKRLDAVVLSTQHDESVSQEQIHEDIKKYVFDAVIPQEMVDGDTKFFINPTGRFVIGGPHGDSGLTGRKIIVDSYGGYARHGGGAFSGKDCTKVRPFCSLCSPLCGKEHGGSPGWQTSVRFSCPTPSVWHIPLPSW